MKSLSGKEKAEFSEIYVDYFPRLVRFAREYVMSDEDAKNIVQDLFLYLWEHRESLEAVSNRNAFLFTLTKNRCIDFYRHKTRTDSRNDSLDTIEERELYLKMSALQEFDGNMFSEEDIETILTQAIDHLPEKCRQIFILSRIEGLKHEEIAQQLDISVHTVQNQISTALRKLKVELKDYLPLLIFMI